MKKLFISVPMKGRTKEAIRESRDKMHKAAEALLGEELEVIDSKFKLEPPEDENVAIFCLGVSIQRMADADYMVCLNNSYDWRGCAIERQVAELYRIPLILLPHEFVVPDEKKALEKIYQALSPEKK